MSGNPQSAIRNPQSPFVIRMTEPSDRDVILDFMRRMGMFRPDEMDVAAEVLDDALAKGPGGHYQSFVCSDAVRRSAIGWVCFGPTPCTVGTFDIYWIAVARDCQGRGVGKALMARAERLIAARGGRLAVVETNGRDEYEPTRQFYLRCGYAVGARVADFYAPGDDKVILIKRLGCGGP